MNFYVVVEGQTDKYIYQNWIRYTNPELSKVDVLSDVKENNFYIISGGGYPFYLEVILSAIDEINLHKGVFDRLIISVDSEDFSTEDKRLEIEHEISKVNCDAEIMIVVQNFCIETWGLGNIKIGPRNPRSQTLKEYKSFFDVLIDDPEMLPPYSKEGLNRAQFAYKYLKLLLNDKQKNLTYTKHNPKALQHLKFYNEVRNRHFTTAHIPSFGDFLNAFV